MTNVHGEVIGGCRLEAQVAVRNGYVRYRACHERSGSLRIVVLTTSRIADSREQLQIFTEEVQIAGILRHTNITRVFEGGVWRGHGYVIQEYLPGGSLADLLRQFVPARRKLPVAFVLDLARQLAEGLAHAHYCGVVHGRVEPGNIQLRRMAGSLLAKLDNFGLSRLCEEMLAVGGLNTTVHYLAPEQCYGETSDARSDIYGLGLMLYEALAGRPAFVGSTYGEVVRRQMAGDMPPLHSIRPDLGPAVEQLIYACLAIEPAQRPQRADALAADLARLIQPTMSAAAD
ncbi:MAG: serine/threonine protein kinase [Oscillochloris sp.]|nr:serine/threonine protein kinase [Oscillochloris sp.]